MSSTEIIPHKKQKIEPSPCPIDASILAGQLAPSSIAMYDRDFRAYLTFSGSYEQALQSSTLARWRTELAQESGKSPNTINRMISAVKRLMREAASQGYFKYEVAASFEQVSGVKVAALKDRVKRNARTRIEPEEMREVCDTPAKDELVGTRDHALLATLASSGLRVSELATLKIEQIVEKPTGYILMVQGKNDIEEREAPLSREAFRFIQAWLQVRPLESQYIFTAFDGRGQRPTTRALSSTAVWKIVRKYANQLGMSDIKPHDFRRFVGTQLAKTDIRMAQKALGHKRIETTARHYVLDELEPGLTDNLY